MSTGPKENVGRRRVEGHERGVMGGSVGQRTQDETPKAGQK